MIIVLVGFVVFVEAWILWCNKRKIMNLEWAMVSGKSLYRTVERFSSKERGETAFVERGPSFWFWWTLTVEWVRMHGLCDVVFFVKVTRSARYADLVCDAQELDLS